MTQENEMPGEIWAKQEGNGKLFASRYEKSYTNTISYIRRAVTKEEAGELDADLSKSVAEDSGSRYAEFVRKYYPLIRKMAEAHK